MAASQIISASTRSVGSVAAASRPRPSAGRGCRPRRGPSVRASAASGPRDGSIMSRRNAIQTALTSVYLMPGMSMASPVPPPPGYRRYVDKLDGYAFYFPETWIPVTTSGNDVFYRNPYSVEENLFVNLSSPSSSKFESVADLGTPEEAALRQKKQFMDEFMSTRIGIKRETEVVSGASREAPDGKTYYDVQVRIKSYATRNQMAVSSEERSQELEYDRLLITTLGTAKGRLYELRLQTAYDLYPQQEEVIKLIQESFRCA